MSLSIALEKIKQGYRVELFEASNQLLGLAGTFSDFDTEIEKFYHFFYKNDHKNSFDWLRQLTKRPVKIHWANIETSTFSNGKFRNFDSLTGIAQIAGWQSFKVFLGLIKLSVMRPSRKLDNLTAYDWSISAFGEKFAQEIWHPLLQQKFGQKSHQVSALWLATRIRRHLNTKGLLSGRSKFGYLVDTYQPYINELEERIVNSGGKIHYNTKITELQFTGKKLSKIVTEKTVIDVGNSNVYSGIPFSSLKLIANHTNLIKQLGSFQAVAVVVLVLKLKRDLSKSYWTTVSDPSVPFTAILQQNNLYARTADRVVYLSRYCDQEEEVFSQSDQNIKDAWLNDLLRIYPHLNVTDIVNMKVVRAAGAAPVPTVFSHNIFQGIDRDFENFFFSGYEEIYPEDRGVGNSVLLGRLLAAE